jgi:hypothetical protein
MAIEILGKLYEKTEDTASKDECNRCALLKFCDKIKPDALFCENKDGSLSGHFIEVKDVPDGEVPVKVSGGGFDRTAFRSQAAKDILCSLLADGRDIHTSTAEVVQKAVDVADMLMERLGI